MNLLTIETANKLTYKQKDIRSKYRSVHIKKNRQLKELVKLYPVKIARLKNLIKEITDKGDISFLEAKILRLTDKYATVLGEQDIRKNKIYERSPIGTTYYIDLDGGNDANDGLSIGQAWLTLEKYTTTTVRTAGDIAYVRANTTETVGANDIAMDEDGTVDAYISIIGCDSVTNDPWSDSSDVKPTIDFGDQTQNIILNGDVYWKLERLDVIQSADILGGIYIANAGGTYLSNCKITDSVSIGVFITNSSNVIVENCSLEDNVSHNIRIYYSSVIIKNCTFNGGAIGTSFGVLAYGANIIIEDCSFGQTTAHSSKDMLIDHSAIAKCINCLFDSQTASRGGIITSEDDQQVKGANVLYAWNGIITKDTGIVRSGGASSSAKVAPDADCGLYAPVSVSPFNEHDFKIYCAASLTTLTIYIRSLGVWAGYPTNVQLYIEASYLDHAVNSSRTLIASTEVINDETTWRAFTVTFTPLQAGLVYLNVFLKKYESSKGIYVDVLPIVL